MGEIKMSEKKRFDKKRRVLKTGEIQKADGRYRYKYINYDGKEAYVYSWRLLKTDSTPNGKKDEPSLRELEEQIQKELEQGCAPFGGNLTVHDLAKYYVDLRFSTVRINTQSWYKTILNILKNDPFGARRIDTVNVLGAKKWFSNLQNGEKRSYSSICTIRGVLRPAFQQAYNDDLIQKNPFDFPVSDVVVNNTKKREAITEEQEEAFLEFVKNNHSYYRYFDGMYILFHTGLRISEFCGLTIDDIDFKNHTINVDKQLMKRNKKYYIQSTKTSSGTRLLPMTPDVEECFKNIIANRPKLRKEPMIDGVTGFLCFDVYGNVAYALHWGKHFSYALGAYNRESDLYIKALSPHICRHTYCTRMAMKGMNPKTLQYLMGHSEVDLTLNVYTHVALDDAKEELSRMKLI